MKKKVGFYTLGCKLNYSESSTIAREFVDNGFDLVSSGEIADVFVINTCSVTEHADKKSRSLIRRLNKLNPEAIIAVTGCYAQLKPEEILSIEGVDIVIGAIEKGDLYLKVSQLIDSYQNPLSKSDSSCQLSSVKTIFPAYSSDDRSRSFLKIQDGCDYNCSYCTIPLARGRSRNIPIDEVVAQAEEIAKKGYKEIVLTGVNTGDFGKSSGEPFFTLLQRLEGVYGIERYRISSIEPNLLTEEIVDFVSASHKFLPHFHIPLQSGSDAILAKMRRRYNRALFSDKIAYIREKIPYCFIGVDLIVGFPDETEECFMESYNFLSSISPSFIHLFPYSRRLNTPASEYPNQVKEIDKKRRVEIMARLSERLYEAFRESNRGRVEEVLFENSCKGGKMFGYTKNYIRVEQPYDKNIIGKIVPVSI